MQAVNVLETSAACKHDVKEIIKTHIIPGYTHFLSGQLLDRDNDVT